MYLQNYELFLNKKDFYVKKHSKMQLFCFFWYPFVSHLRTIADF